IGVVSRVIDASTFEVTLSGEISGLSGLTVGEVYFLSASTAGLLTTTEPTVVGQVSVPVGVASSTTSLYVAPKRGSVVGSSNARTQIALANNATTTVQNIAAYDAGELTGWVSITATTPLRFYVAAQFSKNGAANNYNVSYQVSGDTPPTGFVVTATAAGLLQITLPSITGFASASINYALNAPAVGTSFPLTVDSSGVQFQKIVPKDTAGISVRNAADSATNVFISDAGNVGIGTTSPITKLMAQVPAGGASLGLTDSTNSTLYIKHEASNLLSYETLGTATQRWVLNGVERMKLVSSGNLTVGPSEFTTSGCIELNASASGDRSTFIDFHSSGTPGSLDFSARLIRLAGSTGSFDIINVTNGVRLAANGTSWAAISDQRQKKNIKDLEYGLDQIKAIRPVRFDYNAEESEESKRLGFVAQELLPVVKEAVYGSEDSEYSVSPTDLIPVMVKAIQELKEELDAAKEEIAALKGV
ncbi:tail fiber domain-containing protein, partial [bacterium]|nr:tail fiber domain-containing protein [bacterium]